MTYRHQGVEGRTTAPGALTQQELFQRWFDRGEEEANAGRYLQALRCFQEATVVWPTHPEALLYQVVCLIHLGKAELALGIAEAVLSHVPHHPQGWLFRGVALRRLGRYKEAYASYDRAVSLAAGQPPNPSS